MVRSERVCRVRLGFGMVLGVGACWRVAKMFEGLNFYFGGCR